MSINFTPQRWEELKNNYRKWWAGELDRPVVGYTIDSLDPGRPEPSLKPQAFTAAYDLSVPAEEIVDRWDYDLSKKEFFGDAYPMVIPNFGPGVVAAFLGAELRCSDAGDTVWFHPTRPYDITATKFEYDPDNIWLNRIKDIYRAAIARWNGSVQISMTDMGGTLDVLSAFFPSEELLLHLYDYPQHTERLIWNIHELWWKYYNELNSVLQPVNPGYTSWDGVFSEIPHYILQSDFSYMISPEMFETFVRPELSESCKKLGNNLYHMDGVGEIPHLAILLDMEELYGIQWVPGSGKPQHAKDWMDIYSRIIETGKKVLLVTGESLEQLSLCNANSQLVDYMYDKNNCHIANKFIGKRLLV